MPTSGDAKPNPKPMRAVKRAKRRTPEQIAESLLWHRDVMMQNETLYSTAGEPRIPAIQAHHVIPRQVCRQHSAPSWDSRNGIRVSGRRHTRHHAGIEPIQWDELHPLRRYYVQHFAIEYGLEPWLERHVPGFTPGGASVTAA